MAPHPRSSSWWPVVSLLLGVGLTWLVLRGPITVTVPSPDGLRRAFERQAQQAAATAAALPVSPPPQPALAVGESARARIELLAVTADGDGVLVALRVTNLGADALPVALANVTLRTRAGNRYQGAAGEPVTLAPGDSVPIDVTAPISPADAGGLTVVVTVAGGPVEVVGPDVLPGTAEK